MKSWRISFFPSIISTISLLANIGSFGSGKTTVANMFKKHGYKIINTDRLYHGIYNKDPLKNKIKKEFGTLDRKNIKKIVFDDSKKLKILNVITHPTIIKTIKKEIKRIKNKKIIVDVPLLFESKIEKMFDKIIVVNCNKNEQVKRILKNKKYSIKEINQIIKSQIPLKEKINKADYVINNNKTNNNSKIQVNELVKQYFIK